MQLSALLGGKGWTKSYTLEGNSALIWERQIQLNWIDFAVYVGKIRVRLMVIIVTGIFRFSYSFHKQILSVRREGQPEKIG